KFVRVIVTASGIRFAGKDATWADVRKSMDELSAEDRPRTVLELAVDSMDLPVSKLYDAKGEASTIVKDFGLAYLSDTGLAKADERASAGDVAGEYFIDGVLKRSGVYTLN